MHITILSHDLSNNCLGRAYLLAQMLSKKHKITICGPLITGEKIWKPLQNTKDISIQILPEKGKIHFLTRVIISDIYYVIKPKPTSLWYGIFSKCLTHKPLIVDIDDWEVGLFFNHSIMDILKNSMNPRDINNLFFTYISQWLVILFANRITVASKRLQDIYGGTLISHARNEKVFVTNSLERIRVKKKFGLQKKFAIGFLGTIRKHKGVEDIIRAINSIKDDSIVLVLFKDESSQEYSSLQTMFQDKHIIWIPPVSFQKLPSALSLLDIVVVPQLITKASFGQTPVKLIDAMAMKRPIIASSTIENHTVLSGFGIIYESGNYHSLAKKILYIKRNNRISQQLSQDAYNHFIHTYSYRAITPKLLSVFDVC